MNLVPVIRTSSGVEENVLITDIHYRWKVVKTFHTTNYYNMAWEHDTLRHLLISSPLNWVIKHSTQLSGVYLYRDYRCYY